MKGVEEEGKEERLKEERRGETYCIGLQCVCYPPRPCHGHGSLRIQSL